MATIPRPYTRQVQSFNPQRSAATGRPQALLEELSPAMRYRPQAPVSQMLYSAPPSAEQVPMVDYFGGGPGVGAFGGEGGPTGIEGTTDPAQQAINASILGIDSPLGFMMGKGNPFGTLIGMAIRGGNEMLGDPLGKAKDLITGKLGLGKSAQGMLGEIGQTSEDAVNAALEASIPESIDVDVDFPDMSNVSMPDFAPPSSLADIGIGGGFGAAGDVGNAGFGGLGGIASY